GDDADPADDHQGTRGLARGDRGRARGPGYRAARGTGLLTWRGAAVRRRPSLWHLPKPQRVTNRPYPGARQGHRVRCRNEMEARTCDEPRLVWPRGWLPPPACPRSP